MNQWLFSDRKISPFGPKTHFSVHVCRYEITRCECDPIRRSNGDPIAFLTVFENFSNVGQLVYELRIFFGSRDQSDVSGERSKEGLGGFFRFWGGKRAVVMWTGRSMEKIHAGHYNNISSGKKCCESSTKCQNIFTC